MEYVEFPPHSKGKKKIYIAVGSATAALVAILTSLGIIWKKWYWRNKISREKGSYKKPFQYLMNNIYSNYLDNAFIHGL